MTCNMNERTVQPSLLVLSRAVYAKRQQDSTFHSGSVETKLPDGRFMVHFTDGSCEKVPERNITWLGFWGLPPSSWPTRPIVNIAGHLNELDSATTQDHAIGKSISESCPGLIKTIGNTHTASYPAETHFNTVNEKANDLRCAIDHTRKTDVSKIDSAIFFKKSLKHDTPRILPDNLSANQRRLSVLRICHVDKSKKNLVVKKQENPNDVETDHGPSAIKRSPPLKEETITRKRKASPEYFVKNQKFEHISPYLSQIYQKYGEAFHISTCPDTRVNVVPKSFRVESRPKKRSENKKCRKVYGIENRDIWCTQCKWKKACSRFATNDKTDPSMMYITGHDAMHCPV